MAKKEVYTYEKPVKLGDKGTIVKGITSLLGKHGSAVKVTEVYHIGVRSAVMSFQKKNGLKPTGVVDKKTWTKLNK
ncbi:MAG: peptidoglycan-binding protein [Clostridium sp.]|nr:peptidoglycan-binding protein [Clostridium sp.]